MQNTSRSIFALRTISVVSILAVVGVWAATGAHLGWTQTSKVTLQHDEVTGIDFPVRQKTFVAGVEVLATGVGFAAVFAASSVFVQRRAERRARA